MCVIDENDDVYRSNAWLAAGASALIDGSEPLDQLLRTINRLLRRGSLQQSARAPSQSMALTGSTRRPQDGAIPRFANLTERERIVLAELTEGHCAEEIAQAAFVSISTVRSQIKAILQKLGVSSQLAAVALARRADWSLDSPTGTSPKPSNSRPRHASSDLLVQTNRSYFEARKTRAGEHRGTTRPSCQDSAAPGRRVSPRSPLARLGYGAAP